MKLSILVLCATQRGKLFLATLMTLLPEAKLTVCSFQEEPSEPLFFEEIKNITLKNNHAFYMCKNISKCNLIDSCVFDIMLCVSWRFLVSEEIYKEMKIGAFVFHDSLLPAYRGFSPTVWSIINGETKTGVSLFKMGAEIDKGFIIDQEEVGIKKTDYIEDVMKNVTSLYIKLLTNNIFNLINSKYEEFIQNESLATYTCKRNEYDNKIDWTANAENVYNLIRATSHPYSGSFCFLENKKIRIWKAEEPDTTKTFVGIIPGKIIGKIKDKGALVLAGDFPLLIKEVQYLNENIVTADKIFSTISQKLV